MKWRLLTVVLGILASFAALAGKAPPPPPPPPPAPAATPAVTPTDVNRTRFYAGLKWDLPGPLAPELVLALRRIREQPDGDKRGFDVSFAFSFFKGFQPGKIRLKAFSGSSDTQAEAGGGYDLVTGKFFVGPSVNLPHVNLGLDWLIGGGLQPYGMINTLDK